METCKDCRWVPCRCETHCLGCIPPEYSENGERWVTDTCDIHFLTWAAEFGPSSRQRDRWAKRRRRRQFHRLHPWAFFRAPKSRQAQRRWAAWWPKRWQDKVGPRVVRP